MEQQLSLFDVRDVYKPLASRMRPERLEDFAGQKQLLGERGVLRRMIHQAVRNGAKRVYVADTGLTDAGTEAAKAGERTCMAWGRLHPGDKFGYYRLAEPDGEREASGSGFLTALYEG